MVRADIHARGARAMNTVGTGGGEVGIMANGRNSSSLEEYLFDP